MRRLACLFSFFAVCLVQAQQTLYPWWPQPIVRGTMIVYGTQAESLGRDLLEGRASTGAPVAVVGYQEGLGERYVPFAGTGPFSAIWLRDTDELEAAERFEVLLALEQVRSAGGVVCGSVLEAAMLSVDIVQPATGPARGTLLFAPAEVDPLVEVSRLEVPASGALLIVERRLQSIGASSRLHLAEGTRRRVREELTTERSYDLVALKRRLVEWELPPFPVEEPDPPHVPSGALFIAGGGSLPRPDLQRFVDACGGEDAHIVYVPVSIEERIEQEPGFVRLLRSLGAGRVSWIHTKDRAASNGSPAILDPLRDATGVWFGGGRQWNLVDSYHDTAAHELMWKVLERGGAIGGSSAGASIQAELLARGDPLGNQTMLAPGYLRGLGFLPGAIVDQHFAQRSRQADLLRTVRRYPQYLGIGLDEGTMIVVRGSEAEVIGTGEAWFYDLARSEEPTRLKAGETYQLPQSRTRR